MKLITSSRKSPPIDFDTLECTECVQAGDDTRLNFLDRNGRLVTLEMNSTDRVIIYDLLHRELRKRGEV